MSYDLDVHGQEESLRRWMEKFTSALGPIRPFVEDHEVLEVWVNPDTRVWVCSVHANNARKRPRKLSIKSTNPSSDKSIPSWWRGRKLGMFISKTSEPPARKILEDSCMTVLEIAGRTWV